MYELLSFLTSFIIIQVSVIQRNQKEWKGFYVSFNALLGYIGTATSETLKEKGGLR